MQVRVQGDMPEFKWIYSATFAVFPCTRFGGFVILFLAYFDFSLILKGYNIGQYPAVPKFPILLFYLTSFARYPADPGRRRCSSAHLSGSVQKVAGSGELLARYPAGRRRCSSALLSGSVQRVAGPGELLAWYPAGPGELLA